MSPEEIKNLESEIDQNFKEAHELMDTWGDCFPDGSVDEIKEFSRKLTVIQREISRMIKTLKAGKKDKS